MLFVCFIIHYLFFQLLLIYQNHVIIVSFYCSNCLIVVKHITSICISFNFFLFEYLLVQYKRLVSAGFTGIFHRKQYSKSPNFDNYCYLGYRSMSNTSFNLKVWLILEFPKLAFWFGVNKILLLNIIISIMIFRQNTSKIPQQKTN